MDSQPGRLKLVLRSVRYGLGKRGGFGRRRWRWGFVSAVLVLFLLLSVPSLQFFVLRSAALKNFEEARQDLVALELEAVVEKGKKTSDCSRRAEQSLEWFFWLLNLIGGERWGQEEARDLRVLRYFSESLVYGAQAAMPLREQLRTLRPPPSEKLSLALGDLNRAYNMLLMGQAEALSSEEHWQEFITRSKRRFSLLELFLTSPQTFKSSDSLRRELERYDWR